MSGGYCPGFRAVFLMGICKHLLQDELLGWGWQGVFGAPSRFGGQSLTKSHDILAQHALHSVQRGTVLVCSGYLINRVSKAIIDFFIEPQLMAEGQRRSLWVTKRYLLAFE